MSPDKKRLVTLLQCLAPDLGGRGVHADLLGENLELLAEDDLLNRTIIPEGWQSANDTGGAVRLNVTED